MLIDPYTRLAAETVGLQTQRHMAVLYNADLAGPKNIRVVTDMTDGCMLHSENKKI